MDVIYAQPRRYRLAYSSDHRPVQHAINAAQGYKGVSLCGTQPYHINWCSTSRKENDARLCRRCARSLKKRGFWAEESQSPAQPVVQAVEIGGDSGTRTVHHHRESILSKVLRALG